MFTLDIPMNGLCQARTTLIIEINNHRVMSGINPCSKDKIREFLETFTNTKEFPLYELHSTTAAETAKVLENSFRAMNIAFVQEWTEYAQDLNVDLFEVINAIRVRSTHQNLMFPGFGVGGYCLTKDSCWRIGLGGIFCRLVTILKCLLMLL